MKAAIIAAGHGERLADAGIAGPKPLVRVAGRALVDHVLTAVVAAGIDTVACIVNDESAGVEEHCVQRWPEVSFAFVRKTTTSSMESLFTLAPLLGEEPFLLLTVDAVFAPSTLADFVAASAPHATADVVLGITTFVDDEKPLWVRIGDDATVTALGVDAQPTPWITAGFYILSPRVFTEVEHARRSGFTALRLFLGHLVERGFGVVAVPVGKCIDVDRPEDMAAAEAFVAGGYRE